MNTASNASMQMLLSVMDQAYRWLCQQRRDYPPSADVWDLRFHWHAEHIRLEADLFTGRYHFGPLSVITKADGEVLHLWGARDALVLKSVTLVAQDFAPRRACQRPRRAQGHGPGSAANICRSMATYCAPM